VALLLRRVATASLASGIPSATSAGLLRCSALVEVKRIRWSKENQLEF
jgi:hypothetical protein